MLWSKGKKYFSAFPGTLSEGKIRYLTLTSIKSSFFYFKDSLHLLFQVYVWEEKEKGTRNMFSFVYKWDTTSISHASYYEIPLHSNETASHLPENTTSAFNLVLKISNLL